MKILALFFTILAFSSSSCLAWCAEHCSKNSDCWDKWCDTSTGCCVALEPKSLNKK